MENKNNLTTIITGVVVLVAIILFMGGLNKGATNQVSNTPTSASVKNISGQELLDLKSKCAVDGKKFAQNFEQAHSFPNQFGGIPTWYVHSYHFNSRLNTCLVSVSYNQNNTDANGQDITSPNFVFVHNTFNLLFDAYSNLPVIQSIFKTTTTNSDKKGTTSPMDGGAYSNIPNLDTNTFASQFQVLMNE